MGGTEQDNSYYGCDKQTHRRSAVESVGSLGAGSSPELCIHPPSSNWVTDDWVANTGGNLRSTPATDVTAPRLITCNNSTCLTDYNPVTIVPSPAVCNYRAGIQTRNNIPQHTGALTGVSVCTDNACSYLPIEDGSNIIPRYIAALDRVSVNRPAESSNMGNHERPSSITHTPGRANRNYVVMAEPASSPGSPVICRDATYSRSYSAVVVDNSDMPIMENRNGPRTELASQVPSAVNTGNLNAVSPQRDEINIANNARFVASLS